MSSQRVTDRGSNAPENIELAVKAIGRSRVKRAVFTAVHTGRKQLKTIDEIAGETGEGRQQVLNAAGRLAQQGIIHGEKRGRLTVYRRDPFYQANRAAVLRYREIHAINDVSFEAHAGEEIGIIGPNGSGKSTLMQAVSGLLPVNEGAIYARATPMLLGVGAVLNKTLSGRRNILLGGLALGLTKKQVLKREKQMIEFAGIEDAIDRPMMTYSSGTSARLQFAISAAVKPEILIIDEALAVGDRDFKRNRGIGSNNFANRQERSSL